MALPTGAEWEIYFADDPSNWADGATKQRLKDWSTRANNCHRGNDANVDSTDFTLASDGGVFDGAGDRGVSVASNGWSGVTSCSALVVFKPSAVGTFGSMVATGSAGTLGNFSLCVGASPGAISVEYFGASCPSAGSVVSNGQWYCFIATKAPGPVNTTTVMYLNNKVIPAVGAATGTPSIGNDNLHLVGIFTGAAIPFAGTIAAVIMWKRTLTAVEAADAYAYVKAKLAPTGVTLPSISPDPATTEWVPVWNTAPAVAPTIPVTSVYGRTGAIVAVAGDYTAALVTNSVSTIGSYADPAWLTSLAYAKLTGVPTSLPPTAHVHAAADITTGVMAVARLGTGTPSAANYLRGDGSWATVAAGGSQTPWTSDIDGGGFDLNNAGSIRLNGDLFIANTAPASAVTFRLDGYNDALYIAASGGGGGTIHLMTAELTRLTVNPAGAVGIGTAAPVRTLHVGNVPLGGGMVVSGGAPSFVLSGVETEPNTAPLAVFFGMATAAGHYGLPNAGDAMFSTQGTGRGNLYLSANYQAGDGSKHLLLQATTTGGRVGIGTASPGTTLDVAGVISFLTSINGNGKAVAETSDAYLRINQINQFSQGIWLGPSALKMQAGHLYVGTSGADAGCIDISATASDGANRITLNGNAGGPGIFCKNRSILLSDSISASYAAAAIEIRQTNEAGGVGGDNNYAPRIGFHWTGAIASQLGMDINGIIRTFNNPGTGYEQFACSYLTCYGNCNVTGGYYVNGVPISTGGQPQTPWAQNINGALYALTNVYSITIGNATAASQKLNVVPAATPTDVGTLASYQVSVTEAGNNSVYRLCLGYGIYYSGVYSGSIQVFSNNLAGVLYLNAQSAPLGVIIGVPPTAAYNSAMVKNNCVLMLLDDAANKLTFYVRNNSAVLKSGFITIG